MRGHNNIPQRDLVIAGEKLQVVFMRKNKRNFFKEHIGF